MRTNTPGKNNKNGSQAKTRGSNKQSKVINYENKFTECLAEHFRSNFQDTLGNRETTKES